MRRFLLITAIAWLILSGWLSAYVPPRRHVLVHDDRRNASLRVQAFTAEGNLVVSRYVNVSGGSYETRGPVTVHDPESGRVLVSALTEADKLVEVHWTGRLAVAKRGLVTRAVSLEDGRTLIEYPHRANGSYRTGGLSPSGTRFVVEANDGTVVWDVSQQTPLRSFPNLRSPMFGDDNTLFAARPVVPQDTPNGTVQTESVRIDIDRGEVVVDERRPVYDCGIGVKSPSGEYGISFARNRPEEGFGVFQHGRTERIWTLESPPELGLSEFFHPPLMFTDDSSEIRMAYLAGRHAIGIVRWRTSDGQLLTPLPVQAGRLEGTIATSPDTRWSARWQVISDPRPKWMPASVQKWLRSKLPGVMNVLVTTNRIDIIDNRRDRIAAAIPGVAASSLKMTPDSRSLIVDNQQDIVRYDLPANGQLGWLAWGVAPAVCLWGLALRRRASMAGGTGVSSVRTDRMSVPPCNENPVGA